MLALVSHPCRRACCCRHRHVWFRVQVNFDFLFRLTLRCVAWHPYAKDRPLSNLTLDVDRAMYQFEQAFGDIETKSHATITASHGAVALSEHIEDFWQDVFFDTNPSIGDSNKHAIVAQIGIDRNAPFIREFRCVAEQILQYDL